MKQNIVVLTDSQLNTILAALRAWQLCGYCCPSMRPLSLHEIACPDDDSVSLCEQGVDTLCEQLNCNTLTTQDADFDTAVLWEILQGKHIVGEQDAKRRLRRHFIRRNG